MLSVKVGALTFTFGFTVTKHFVVCEDSQSSRLYLDKALC